MINSPNHVYIYPEILAGKGGQRPRHVILIADGGPTPQRKIQKIFILSRSKRGSRIVLVNNKCPNKGPA